MGRRSQSRTSRRSRRRSRKSESRQRSRHSRRRRSRKYESKRRYRSTAEFIDARDRDYRFGDKILRLRNLEFQDKTIDPTVKFEVAIGQWGVESSSKYSELLDGAFDAATTILTIRVYEALKNQFTADLTVPFGELTPVSGDTPFDVPDIQEWPNTQPQIQITRIYATKPDGSLSDHQGNLESMSDRFTAEFTVVNQPVKVVSNGEDWYTFLYGVAQSAVHVAIAGTEIRTIPLEGAP